MAKSGAEEFFGCYHRSNLLDCICLWPERGRNKELMYVLIGPFAARGSCWTWLGPEHTHSVALGLKLGMNIKR